MAPTCPQHCRRQRQAATPQPYSAGGSSPKGVGVTLFPALGNPSAVVPKAAWAQADAMMGMNLLACLTTDGIVSLMTEVGVVAPTRRGGDAMTRAPRSRGQRRPRNRRGAEAVLMTEGCDHLMPHDVTAPRGLTGAEGVMDPQSHMMPMSAITLGVDPVRTINLQRGNDRGRVACSREGSGWMVTPSALVPNMRRSPNTVFLMGPIAVADIVGMGW